MLFRVHRVPLGILLLAGGWLLTPLVATAAETSFVPLPPCRMVDTRLPGAGGAFAVGETRTFDVVGATLDYSSQGGSATGCGVPGFFSGAPEVQAVAVNVVAVNPTVATAGYLKGWAGNGTEPNASFLNYNKMTPNLNIASGTVLPVRQDSAGDDLAIKASQPVQVVIDVVGYYTRYKDDSFQVGMFPASPPYNAFSSPGPGFGANSPSSGGMIDSGDLFAEWSIEVGSALFLSRNLYMEGSANSGQDGDQNIFFYEDNYRENEYIQWNDFNDRFVVSDDLYIVGAVSASGTVSAGGSGSSFSYNAFTTSTPIAPSSGVMDSTSDLYTQADIEVGGGLYLSKNLFMEGSTSSGQDGNQTIYFYEDGARFNEYIRWDDASDRFAVSDDLDITGTVTASGAVNTGIVNVVFIKSNEGTWGDLWLYHDPNNVSAYSTFSVYTGGSIEQMRIGDGNEAPALFDGTVQANGLDYAEAYKITDVTLEGGDVVSLQLTRKEYIQRSAVPYDEHLVGVISAKPGFVTGDSFNAEEQADPAIAQRRAEARQANDAEAEKQYTLQLQAALQQQQRAVALAGRVPVKVDAGYGPIRAGAYLTASATPGHAMAMTRAGKTLGIALESFAGPGQGTVLALIQPGWYGGAGAATANAATATATDGAVATASGDQVQIRLDTAAGQTSFAVVAGDPSGPGQAVFKVDTGGNVHAQGTVHTATAGLAEYHPVLEPVAPGDVLVASRAEPGWLQRGAAAADAAVVGIVVERPGVVTAADVRRVAVVDPSLAAAYAAAQAAGDAGEMARLWDQIQGVFAQQFAAVALAGTVPCRVDARYGAIAVGDLLVSAPTPGHAMRTDDPLPGTVLGKALAPVAAGTATIPVLVMLQ